MAAASGQRPRRGPAPIASFDHDVSDESSPETKQTFQLPEIREDLSTATGAGAEAALEVREPGAARARSHSTPGLVTPAAPRIDISRASSSSHQDSRDSSPELALFAGAGADPAQAPEHLGFREDGTLELRSSTEELAFLEPAPARSAATGAGAAAAAAGCHPGRRHSRKDSQGSEAALLAISGRTSRISSVGSQCSAQSALSALSHVSAGRLSVVSGASRSPSPHKMLLETSFCGPKPIETEPEVSAVAVEKQLLIITKHEVPAEVVHALKPQGGCEVRTEVRVEAPLLLRLAPAPAPAPPSAADTDKCDKETRNRRARSRERRDREPEVYKSRNRSKDVIRIKLKPDEQDDEDDEEEQTERTLVAGAGAGPVGARKPDSLSLGGARPVPPPARSPSPQAVHSRKSSFCLLFKSRETIASPDSPSDAVRRKKSVSEGRARSKSRERSAPPTASKLRGSMLALFKAPRRSATASPSPPSRAASPAPPAAPVAPPSYAPRHGHLKYYEDTRDGIIHIPLRTPPDADADADTAAERDPPQAPRPASAPCARPTPAPTPTPAPPPPAPMQRTVLPDGSIIIPLHSPTEKAPPVDVRQQVAAVVETPPAVTDSRSSDYSESKRQTFETDSLPLSVTASPKTANAAPAMIATPAEATAAPELTRSRRKERLVFTTNVGSMEQVFSTQLSITKTPSVTSEISGSFPSLSNESRIAPSCPVLRDTHITADPAELDTSSLETGVELELKHVEEATGRDRDSSESEGSSDAGASCVSGAAGRGCEVEARGLVVQESFEEELPFVPTTLPLERSLALPMLPVRQRTPHITTTASVERPRSVSARCPLPPPAPPAPVTGPPGHERERLHIRLPRRASAAAATATDTTHTRPSRSRTRSGSDARKTEWIDFSEVPERRPAARRIQTLPPAPRGESGAGEDYGAGAGAATEPAVSYVEPDQCRCECHRAASAFPAGAHPHPHSSPEEGDDVAVASVTAAAPAQAVPARPFTADLDVADDARS